MTDDPLREPRDIVSAADETRTVARPTRDAPDVTDPPADLPGAAALPERLGHYRIVRLLGEGGMGIVYEAEQERPRRAVALKLIRAGFATASHLRRFEQESEVLGRLQHPGIAQVYEAGVARTDSGPQPYFAMELVRGRPLSRVAAGGELSVRERLDLVARICDAVQHAHDRGVIHRDLKPNNILIDELGRPKILDFGLARATDSDVQASMHTNTGMVLGTVPYMSPEQVSGDAALVDARSDVYALGVILYELLTGRLPLDVRGRSFPDALRAIREDEPSRLSLIDRGLRGDVETIVGKALEKDRDRRYSSASELGDDIRRHLRNEPIVARPTSTAYLVGKFARRHRALVSGLAAVFLVLVAGVIVSTWQAVRARRAEVLAKQEAAKAQAVNTFLQEMLASVDPSQLKGLDVTVRQVLDEAAKKVEGGSLQSEPEIEAAVHATLGVTYHALGLYAEAEPHLRAALESRRSFGAEPVDIAESLGSLASLLHDRGDLESAESLYRETHAILREALGDEHPDVAANLNNLAWLLTDRGDLAGAEPLYRESLAAARKAFGHEHQNVAVSLNNLAGLLRARGDLAGSEPLYREALAIRRKGLPGEHPDLAVSLNNLAALLQARGDLVGAESLSREAVAIWSKTLGDEHPNLAASLNNLGSILVDKGEYAAAESLLRVAHAIRIKAFPARHPNIASSLATLGYCLNRQGRYAEAEPLLREALSIREEALPPGDWPRFDTRSALGEALAGQGKFDAAEPLLLEAYDGMKGSEAAPPKRKHEATERIARMYEAWGKAREAAAWRATLDVSRAASPQ